MSLLITDLDFCHSIEADQVFGGLSGSSDPKLLEAGNDTFDPSFCDNKEGECMIGYQQIFDDGSSLVTLITVTDGWKVETTTTAYDINGNFDSSYTNISYRA